MVGLGVGELILMMMMAGGIAPNDIAFGNPAVWLAQSVLTRSAPVSVLAGALLFASNAPSGTLGGPAAIATPPPPPPAVKRSAKKP